MGWGSQVEGRLWMGGGCCGWEKIGVKGNGSDPEGGDQPERLAIFLGGKVVKWCEKAQSSDTIVDWRLVR